MKWHILAILLLIIITNISYAQEIREVTAEAEIGETPSGLITFSFKDADIRNVLRLIAAKSGVNIVYGPEITGIVNMELKDVPWEQALGLVLDLNGFAYQKEGNVIKVLKKEDISREPLATEVFVLNYANAKEAVEAVNQMLTERGSIKTDTRSNTIIVTDVPANINKVEAVLTRLDMRTPQVLIETRIIEIRDTSEKDLGIKWTSLSGYKVTIQDPSRQLTDTFRTLDERTSSESYAFADDWYGGGTYSSTNPRYAPDYTDPRTIASVSDVPYTWREKYLKEIGKAHPSLPFYGTWGARSHYLTDIRSAILSADDFEILLSALQTDKDVDLISNPRILTANNETAQIKVISEYPVPNYEFDTETSQWSITGFNKEEIGVTFDVTPNISADGYITMRIEPQVSILIDLVPFTAGGATVYIPYVGRKKATAKLVIKSSDTLAVGGLVDEDKENTVTKVPLLGDIPVLGRLFKHESTEKVKKNVIFFITATIIDEKTKGILTQNDPTLEGSSVVYKDIIDVPKAVPVPDENISSGNKGYISEKPETRNQ